MMAGLSEKQVADVKQLKGKFTAAAVAALVDVNPETIRRIWRGETHREKRTPVTLTQEMIEGFRAQAAGEAGPAVVREAGAPATAEESAALLLAKIRGEVVEVAEEVKPPEAYPKITSEMAEMMRKMGGS